MLSLSHFICQFNIHLYRIYFLKQQRNSSRYHSRNKVCVAVIEGPDWYPQISKKQLWLVWINITLFSIPARRFLCAASDRLDDTWYTRVSGGQDQEGALLGQAGSGWKSRGSDPRSCFCHPRNLQPRSAHFFCSKKDFIVPHKGSKVWNTANSRGP